MEEVWEGGWETRHLVWVSFGQQDDNESNSRWASLKSGRRKRLMTSTREPVRHGWHLNPGDWMAWEVSVHREAVTM